MSGGTQLVCIYRSGEVCIREWQVLGTLQPEADGSKWWMDGVPDDASIVWWVLVSSDPAAELFDGPTFAGGWDRYGPFEDKRDADELLAELAVADGSMISTDVPIGPMEAPCAELPDAFDGVQ